MLRYFFYIRDGQTFVDLQGTELADIHAAKREAVQFAGHLLSDQPDTAWDGTKWVLRVTDANDLTLFSLTFFATDGAVNCH
ncbi:hypothetical protein SAMN06297144_2573 [Sphingomonas guangdongensis]|uniref:DUF6894 domain-containing protein n=1 Tax=Sphingomonas guangdongensis TaxID=1141890 RepID=A0A285R017_9SPHN|nr:hypothetical protein [Sphingomonas guangdongensis]SOB87441.1 hypothetical protein SAMN06297144_2573 [Sphingomonas guangdongensis]